MESFLCRLWPSFPAIDIPSSERVLTDAETKERFTVISPFILEFQKQCFENLKFSLNLWTIINSGAAISLLNSGGSLLTWAVGIFMLGAVISGAGSILAFSFSNECLYYSTKFILNSDVDCEFFARKIEQRFYVLYKLQTRILFFSYGCALVATIFLLS